MGSSGGTKLAPALSVVTRTNSTIACLAAPSFQEGSRPVDVAVCAWLAAGRSVSERAGRTAMEERSDRRLSPKNSGAEFTGGPFRDRLRAKAPPLQGFNSRGVR